MAHTDAPGPPIVAGDAVAVAVAQFAPGENTAVNLERIRSLTGAAVARGARLVVFPEYSSFFADPVDARFLDHAQALDGDFTATVAQIADDMGVTIVAGMAERSDDSEHVFNTLVAVAPGAGVVATYRKQHLYDAFGAMESDVVKAGALDAPQLFDVEGVAVGLQTCYDLRFPEVMRRIVDAGAELVLVPSEWVRGALKEHHWRTLITARAIENTIFIAAADHVGPIGIGSSLIVDPMGVTLADAGEQTGIAVAWVSRERLSQVRSTNPALALRRYTVVPRS